MTTAFIVLIHSSNINSVEQMVSISTGRIQCPPVQIAWHLIKVETLKLKVCVKVCIYVSPPAEDADFRIVRGPDIKFGGQSL